ncbi:uncharacterized protein LOC131955424 [Physella acuta]|uniref:uncharacterized protein LOC131955424 n=1 Tax=Physella acuta TaxID=109671 RepID=UPI0027DE627E|nr:uncharacterized protein LOC131955424 [Physella acuta]
MAQLEKILQIFSCFLFCIVFSECSQSSGLTVDYSTNGTYSLLVDGSVWLTNGQTYFYNNGRRFSSADASLKLANTTITSGTDKVGQWQAIQYTYLAGTLTVMASIKTYNLPNLPLVVFSQKYLTDGIGTSAQDPEYVISSFPSFNTRQESDVELGYLGFGGDMAGYNGINMGSWQHSTFMYTGITGGPLVLFDNSSNAMIISPMSQFMAASNRLELFLGELQYGIMGLIDTVPKGYDVDFILYYSDRGINQVIQEWGEFMRMFYNKSPERRNTALTVNYMGYWTDNGAYYYYHTEDGQNYQTTMLDVVKYINQKQIPFKYMQYDSWWYAKGHKRGTVTWTPEADIFPDGFRYLYEQTKLPFGCHNRYWDNQTTYAKYNGGKYNFLSDTYFGLAVPNDAQFWLDLFNMTKQWGQFILYEQDWMNWENDQNKALLTDLTLGRKWLTDMGNGAAAYPDIEIQYCMSYSRHILQSLEVPAVTQARVSEDYHPGGRQWNIGISSMLADAVGLAPFKDTFWTTEQQTGSPYGADTEPLTELNSLLATLSTGPVGPGDGIGYINLTLLMRCCDSTGQILQPNKPATAINDQIKKRAFLSYPGPLGEVYTTHSNVSSLIFGIVMAADLQNVYSLTPSSGWTPGLIPPNSVVYSGTAAVSQLQPFSESSPLQLGQQCTARLFCLFYTSPVLQLGSHTKVILLGELDKWVPMSSKRFRAVAVSDDDVTVELTVNARETVTFNYVTDNDPVRTVVCDNSQSSRPADVTIISIAKSSCTLKFF